mmetsp:Transcript_14032/g.33621  ORF Transcript_14032/g.33621 Transcript_14032/m.33621 type:complete len:367 (+) Transcript_14032:143-1243(+)|eukprot:CAMPEP_0197616398 /NCGR_PEP_ID=MMETSP1326-20131121/60510_1 /TAXON_ID=1155430 /ORGANISM="Genus nov. species nov., Strain RCC2288" /LENGTH=366 /DNA_ID=CAMNT_0043185285 /DNA_START=824 /DNA_END=1924 /DNA_ORIENTATION=-
MFAAIERGTARTPWDFSHARGGAFDVGVKEELLRRHLRGMVRGFEAESMVRVPKGSLREFVADTVRDQPEAPPPNAATALIAGWTTFPAVSFASSAPNPGDVESQTRPVAVVMHGHVSNAQEMRELYGLAPAEPAGAALGGADFYCDVVGNMHQSCPRPPSPDEMSTQQQHASSSMMPPPAPLSPSIEGAALILDLYMRRFEDKDHDASDQPVTALTACEGSFSFILVDSERDAVLICRSAESDTHPMFWGTAAARPTSTSADENDDATAMDDGEDFDGTVLLSSDLASIDGPCGGAAVPFPLGALYYCDNSMDYGLIQRLSLSGSRSKRTVQPLHRVNSHGQVCGLGFYTESGNDLASLAHKYIS